MTGDELRDRIAAALLDEGLPPLPASRLSDVVMVEVREAVAAELDAAADEMVLSRDEQIARDRAARWRAATSHGEDNGSGDWKGGPIG